MCIHWPGLNRKNKYNDNAMRLYSITVEHTPKYHNLHIMKLS